MVKQALLCGPSVMDWDVTSCQLIWCRGWVTSLWSASVSLAQTPSAQPFHIPTPSPSIPVPPHTTPIFSPSLIWTIRAKTGEASFSSTHTPLLVYHFLSSILRCLPLTPLSHRLSHTGNPSRLVVDGGVNSALWRRLRVWFHRGCLANWLTQSFQLMEIFFLCGGHLVSRQPDRYSELIASVLPSCCW